jgi:hypothetical protein
MKTKAKETSETEREEFYEHKPKRELKASLSKDGRYWIFKDVTTHIVSREYLEKIERSVQENGAESRDRNKALGAGNAKGN